MNHQKNFNSYVINLDRELDRWNNCQRQSHKYKISLLRVKAVEISELQSPSETFVSDGVRAVWASHMKCFQIFLESKESHALILEDDFQVEDFKKLTEILNRPSTFDFDLIQLGFLKPGPDIAIRVMVANLETRIFKCLAFISGMKGFRKFSFANRLRVAEARNIPSGFTADDYQPGAHCYLVSRRLAQAVLKLNNPQFLCIDDFFTALSQMRTFNSIRVRKSLVSQAPYQKWQGDRFLKI